MPTRNNHLTRANGNRNDEFYTRLSDIEEEMAHHAEWFADKAVWCNCDDPVYSDFITFFKREFEALGLKDLICTGYNPETGEPVGWRMDGGEFESRGDFREHGDLLAQADVVVTNPPFKLFRENLHATLRAGKDILMLGGLTIVNRRDVFPLIRDRVLMCGESVTKFNSPAGTRAVSAKWYGTLPATARHGGVEIKRFRCPMVHRRYDDYPAIDIHRVADIPADWEGEMGVPITFLSNWDPDQFEVAGALNIGGEWPSATLDGENPFSRLLIRHMDSAGEVRRLEAAREAAMERDRKLAESHEGAGPLLA